MSEVQDVVRPKSLVVDRLFPAPRALVFEAWSSADHIKSWFSPADCSVPEADIDFRVGGVFAVLMRTPDGDSWCKGHFTEISPPGRLAFTSIVSFGGEAKLSVQTAVTFEAAGFGTRMTVRQDYEIHDAAFASAVAVLAPLYCILVIAASALFC